jgi:hypothetical protein
MDVLKEMTKRFSSEFAIRAFILTIKKITTRVYYAGEHELEIQINGQSFGRIAFALEI